MKNIKREENMFKENIINLSYYLEADCPKEKEKKKKSPGCEGKTDPLEEKRGGFLLRTRWRM